VTGEYIKAEAVKQVEAGAHIIDPCNKLTRANILAAEALAGRDESCTSYIGAFRAGDIEV